MLLSVDAWQQIYAIHVYVFKSKRLRCIFENDSINTRRQINGSDGGSVRTWALISWFPQIVQALFSLLDLFGFEEIVIEQLMQWFNVLEQVWIVEVGGVCICFCCQCYRRMKVWVKFNFLFYQNKKESKESGENHSKRPLHFVR